ncbi:MAG: prepilin-type N-terminal cleavage/methylation domain-containing protein [Phycisphaerales bacterium]|nr:prepilin-type N-terminal cleavage/methylation domain-containing protein [Phycisphaerales bacterium]
MNNLTSHANTRTSQAAYIVRRGFTIIELLVVVLIGLIILSIAVPAFQSMIYSSNRSLAVNAVEAASLMARDVALSSGQDGAVVFVYDPVIGKVQIIPAVMVGTLKESTAAPVGGGGLGFNETPFFYRDVFVPATSGETIEMPSFWMVRGYAPPHSMIDRDSAGNPAAVWFTSDAYGGVNPNDAVKDSDHWVFPETGFFARNSQVVGGSLDGDFDNVNAADPTARQSFMIRFNARTGVMSRDTNSALFLNPRNSRLRPYGDQPRDLERALRVDLADDVEAWAQRAVEAGNLTPEDTIPWSPNDETLRTQIIGNASNDTILVKPVTRIAVYDERKLGIGVNARGLNKLTNTLYLPADQSSADNEIKFDETLFASGFSESLLIEQIDQWIDGDTNFDGFFNSEDEPETRLYLIQSYTGELQEVLR